MLSYYAKRSSSEEFEQVKTPTGTMLWVRGEQFDTNDADTLAKQFELNRNILEDLTDRSELPRAEYNDGKEYVFVRVPQPTTRGKVLTEPLLMVIDGPRFFSLSHGEALFPLSTIEKTASVDSGAMGLLLATTAGVVGAYEELSDQTARIIQDTRQRLKSHEVTNQDFIHFVTVEDNLNQYQMNLEGMLAVTSRLKENAHKLFNAQDLESLDDIILHIRQLLVEIDTHFKSVESIRNAYTTIANNTLNTRIKTLTVFTVLITLPNVIFGMYGMNVMLPFKDEPWAYAVIILFTTSLIGVVWALAKRFKIF